MSDVRHLDIAPSTAQVFRKIADAFFFFFVMFMLAAGTLSFIGAIPGGLVHNLTSRVQAGIIFGATVGIFAGVVDSARGRRRADEAARMRFAQAVKQTDERMRPMMRAQYHLALVSQSGATASLSWGLLLTLVIGMSGVLVPWLGAPPEKTGNRSIGEGPSESRGHEPLLDTSGAGSHPFTGKRMARTPGRFITTHKAHR